MAKNKLLKQNISLWQPVLAAVNFLPCKMDGKKIIGYREAMVLPQQPKSMIVVGSGAIGVEFAYFYNSMGTKVTIVEFLPRIVPVEDEEISKELEKNLQETMASISMTAQK